MTHRRIHAEVIANQIVGILIGWTLVYWAFPLMGVRTTPTQATVSTVMFFAASYLRMWTIRWWFERRRP